MTTVEIRRCVDFPRGESGGGDDNNVAAAAASADTDAADSGDCAIHEGGQDGGGAGKHHNGHRVRLVLLSAFGNASYQWEFFLPAGKSPLQESYYPYDQSYILNHWY